MKLVLHGPTEIELTELAGGGHFHVEGDAGGEGFGPMQMFVASIALCTASVLVGYDEGVAHAGVEHVSIRVGWQYAESPRRVSRIAMTIRWPGLDDRRLEPARRAAESCTLHRTLEQPPEIDTVVTA